MKNLFKKYIPKNILNMLKFFLGKGRIFYPYRKYTDRYKCIFIHIPKVAGTSVLSLLMGYNLKRDHLSYRIYQEADFSSFCEYYKFCFVRNPYDRLVSTYEYLKSGGNKTQDVFFENLIKEKYDSFDSFVLDYLDCEVIFSHVLFKPQYTYIYDFKYECMVDFIGRFERLEEDFYKVSKYLGIKGTLAKVNVSKRSSYEDYYKNKKVIEKVYNLYRKDFELLGYDANEFH